MRDKFKQVLSEVLNNTGVESAPSADNLAIVLVSYFEHHINKPSNAEEDYDGLGWSDWAMKKTDEAVSMLADELMQRLQREGYIKDRLYHLV